MNKFTVNKSYIITVMLLWIGVSFAYGGDKNPKFYIFTNEPAIETFKNAYPEAEEFYDSDVKLVFVAAADYSKPEKYQVRVQLQNNNGIKIYDEQQELNPKYHKTDPLLYYTLFLEKSLKSKLADGMVTARLYVDGRPYEAKQLKYNPENIVNKNYNQVIVLPFYCTGDRIWDFKAKNEILSTFADAFHGEIKRIIPATMPPDVAKQKVMGLNLKKCFKDPACLRNLRDVFGEGLFITGDMAVPVYNFHGSYSEVSLEILVVNSKTWETRKFAHVFMPTTMLAPEAMKILIQKILYQQGLLAYVRGL
ncbi:MAG: hypothetical protein EHM45_14350 [Desulfobacteraceae bacterium]|nr:MAG: hypothetical protein EHM45_14350 [Desulfobacteraceae bacterium]